MKIFENDNFYVADKPSGVLTTPARAADDPRPCLGRELQARLGVQIYPVHRLDFEVSGLVLFAKTANAHRVAQAWFEHRQVVKTYQARSNPPPPSVPVAGEWMEWHSRLVRGKRRSFEAPHGQPALTRARILPGGLWELQPVTGRPHQLRVEMAKHGHPIQGDVLYGAPAVNASEIALRAVELDFRAVGERLGLPEVLRIDGLLTNV